MPKDKDLGCKVKVQDVEEKLSTPRKMQQAIQFRIGRFIPFSTE